jgi:hypothetical protein
VLLLTGVLAAATIDFLQDHGPREVQGGKAHVRIRRTLVG